MNSTCSYCGANDLEKGLGVALTIETGTIGLECKKEKKGFFAMANPVEPLRIDLCKKCGTVQRFYVTNVDRKWASLGDSTNIQ